MLPYTKQDDNKRLAIDLSALKQLIWDNRDDCDEEVDVSKGDYPRLIDTSVTLSDCLTKTMTSCRLNETLSTGIFDMRPTEESLAIKATSLCETTDGDQTDGNAEREGKEDWSHLYGPEYCSECGQNPFECGCLNVNFESKGGERNVGEIRRNRLRDLQEEMAEISLRVERLERAMPLEGSGSSSSSGGSEWASWNGAWWIRTGSRMNLAGKRRVSRAVHQVMSRQGDKVRNDMNKLMAYFLEVKLENLSDNDCEMAFRQGVTQTEDAWNIDDERTSRRASTWDIDHEKTARRAKGGQLASTRKATSGASTCACETREWPGTLFGLVIQNLRTPGFSPGKFH